MAGDTRRYQADGIAVPASIDQLHELLERVAAEHPEVAAADLMLFETAVIELAGNIVEHGRPEGEVTFDFTLDVHPDRLEALLRDTGYPLPEGSDPDGATMPDAWAEDGRGLALAGAALDELAYEREPEANAWRLVRRRR